MFSPALLGWSKFFTPRPMPGEPIVNSEASSGNRLARGHCKIPIHGLLLHRARYDAANHRIEQIRSGNDTVYFYGPNEKLLAEFSLALTPGVSWYSSLRLDSVYFGGILLGTTQGVATTEYSSIVDRLGTGHPGYA